MKLTDIEKFAIDKVRARRNELGMTQLDLAVASGYSSSFIAVVESGRYDKKYNLNNLNAFAKALKCSVKDFLPDEPF